MYSTVAINSPIKAHEEVEKQNYWGWVMVANAVIRPKPYLAVQ